MAATIICGPCGYEDSVKNAKKWCTDCEEGFCEDCEKVHRSTKMSRNHKMISISDYHKIKGVSINQTCVGHGKRYDLYCAFHDKPLCIDCVDQHKSCSQLVSLDNAATNAKQSTALADLQDTINGAIQNVGRCIKSQERINEEFDQQESRIKKNIQETREKLNQHLDLWEHKLMQNLSTKTCNCKLAYGKVLNQLNLADKKLSQLKEEIETMTQMASDVQIFLCTREFNITVSEELKSIKSMIKSSNSFEIKIDLDSNVKSLLDCLDQLEIITIAERHSEQEFKDPNLDQAQKQVFVSSGFSNRVVDLQLKKRFKFRSLNRVSNCLILPNGHMLIVNCWEQTHIKEYDEQGHTVRNIPCSPTPYYLTFIDCERITVTYVLEKNIEIINLNKTLVQKVTLKDCCRGISYQDGKLYVIEKTSGIVVLDLSGKILNTLEVDTRDVFDISTCCDRIYYTKEKDHTIHCLNMTGQEIWMHQSKAITCPQGLTAANEKEVFVVGAGSNNVSILEQNGLENKIIIKETDGLNNPRAVYYNKDRKELLVCNQGNGGAVLYKILLVS